MNLSIFDVSLHLQAVQETFRAMNNTAKMAVAHSKSFRAATETAGWASGRWGKSRREDAGTQCAGLEATARSVVSTKGMQVPGTCLEWSKRMGKTAAVAFVPDSESPCLLSRLCKSTVYQEAFFVRGERAPGLSPMGSLLPRGFVVGWGAWSLQISRKHKERWALNQWKILSPQFQETVPLAVWMSFHVPFLLVCGWERVLLSTYLEH